MIKINDYRITNYDGTYVVQWCDPKTHLLPFFGSFISLKEAINDCLYRIQLFAYFQEGIFLPYHRKKITQLYLDFDYEEY